MPDIGIQEVTTKMLAAITDEYKANGKARMAQTLRSVWIDLFKEAQHAGKLNLVITRPLQQEKFLSGAAPDWTSKCGKRSLKLPPIWHPTFKIPCYWP
jgi:hypothetical protein